MGWDSCCCPTYLCGVVPVTGPLTDGYHVFEDGAGGTFTALVENGRVVLADTASAAQTNLTTTTVMDGTAGQILPASVFALVAATDIRVHDVDNPGQVDLVTTDPTLLARIPAYQTLDRGIPDNPLAATWLGNGTGYMGTAFCTSSGGTTLDANIIHRCGNQATLNWIPSLAAHRAPWVPSTFRHLRLSVATTSLTPVASGETVWKLVKGRCGIYENQVSGDTATAAELADLDVCDLPGGAAADQPLVQVFQGEDSGTTDTNRYNMSLGNGNEHLTLASAFGWGAVLPADFKATKVTVGARINPANGSSYQLTKSVGGAANALVGPAMTMAGNTLAQSFDVDIDFEANDVINVWTVEGGATDCVVSVWGVWL